MQKDNRINIIILLFGGFIFSGMIVEAQPPANKPSAITQVPNPTGQIAIRPTDPTSMPVNYIRTWEPKHPVQTPILARTGSYNLTRQSTQYLDGLARPVQTVIKENSPLEVAAPKDLVSPVVYDAFGRETFKYLPYTQSNNATNDGNFKPNVFTDQDYFFKSIYKDASNNLMYANEQALYSRTEFEASALNRPLKTFSPGNSWAGSYGSGAEKANVFKYLTNISADDVRTWTISFNALTYSNNDVTTNIPLVGVAYTPGELFKNVVIDEQGNVSVEYKDKDGKILLKKSQVGTSVPADYSGYTGFLCTYYIYDDFSQLRFIIPPKAVEAIRSNWVLTSIVINELCFRYEYDDDQRMIAKKIPGAGWTYMVYDTRDRLVFSQDANMRDDANPTNNKWLATLYDAMNRPVLTGIISYSGNLSVLQAAVTAQTQAPISGGTPANLILSDPNNTGTYQALQSIDILPPFQTPNGAIFTAEIISGGGGGSGNEVTVIEGVAVTKNPIPSGSTFVALTVAYYDDYTASNKSYISSYNTVIQAIDVPSSGTPDYPDNLPGIASAQTIGFQTGSKTRVIEDPANLSAGIWLKSSIFFDEKGRPIQVQTDNYTQGNDILTNRYNFLNMVVSTYLVHNSTYAPQLRIKTVMQYDQAGRLKETWKIINDDVAKMTSVGRYLYDDLGKLKKKELGKKKDVNGNYTSSPIETLDYTYNIRGWLKGINKYYANAGATETDRWFGMEINYDWGFGTNFYNGNIAGGKWRSRGDGERRAYGYGYDKNNRLMGGDFSQHDGTNYVDNTNINFDMQMGDGINASSAYDENGNIKAMKQAGLKFNSSAVIDDMVYNYFTNSNKLSSVVETNTGTTNHNLGDFTDKNTGGNDYGYDKNGSLISDLNRRISGSTGLDLTSGGGISYNHMNLPYQLAIKQDDGVTAKGTITYVYDAAGIKLKKTIVENPSITNGNQTITTTTFYMGLLVYESKTTGATTNYSHKLQFLNHEEGRIRALYNNTSSPATVTGYAYDYMVMDHLGNVRTVLTDEQQLNQYPALSYEGAGGSQEITDQNNHWENSSGQSIGVATVRIARPSSFGTAGTNGDYSHLLKKSTGAIGATKLLKVMSGDRIHTKVDYFYTATNASNTGANGFSSLIGSLANMILNSSSTSSIIKGQSTAIASQVNIDPAATSFFAPESGGGGTNQPPKAYLHVVLFDEMFKFDNVNSFVQRVAYQPNTKGTIDKLAANAVEVKKNGYAYVYISNESEENVYFDNFLLTHERSPLLEETHYYPFGLTMMGISSKALAFGNPGNKLKFNGVELSNNDFSDKSGLEIYETAFRSYDPQLGRFHQIDPLSDLNLNWSPYVFTENNPILFADPFGLDKEKGQFQDGDKGGDEDRPDGKLGEEKVLSEVTVTASKKGKKTTGSSILESIFGYIDLAYSIREMGYDHNSYVTTKGKVKPLPTRKQMSLQARIFKNRSTQIKTNGMGLSFLSNLITLIQIRDQYLKGGIENVNPVDGVSLGVGTVGLVSNGLSLLKIGGTVTQALGGTAGVASLYVSAYQLWMTTFSFIYNTDLPNSTESVEGDRLQANEFDKGIYHWTDYLD